MDKKIKLSRYIFKRVSHGERRRLSLCLQKAVLGPVHENIRGRLGFTKRNDFLCELLNSASKGRRRVLIDVHCALHILLYFPLYFSLNS